MGFGIGIQLRFDPDQGLLALLIGGLRIALGRHVMGAEGGNYALPDEVVFRHRRTGGQLFQADAGGGEAVAVAIEAVVLENRRGFGRSLIGAANAYGSEDKQEHAHTSGQRSL